MSDSLRDALEDMCAKADRREAMRRDEGSRPVPARVGVDVLRSLLAAHPVEPAPVASPEHVAEVLKTELLRQQADDWFDVPGLARYLRESLLAAGVFREPPTHDEISAAVTKAVADYRGYLVFDGCGTVAADAVLNLLGGAK